MEELLELLNDIKEDVDFENEKALVCLLYTSISRK